MLSEKLNQLIRDGYVMVRKHPTQPLHILNYTAKTQIERVWCKDTIACRGLIVNENGKVVSRPFKKFFNVGELSYFSDRMDTLYGIDYSEVFSQEFSVHEKLDGSLGISYIDGKGQHRIASRGSFDSEQAVKANEIFQKKYAGFEFEKNKTYLFEIIFRSNRIVCDYGDTEDLYLLAIIDTETGKDLEVPDNLPFPRPKKYDSIYGFSSLSENGPENEEGYVLVNSNGFRAKWKFLDYCIAHRAVSHFSCKHIVESIQNNTYETILETLPDELYQEAKRIYDSYQQICLSVTESSKYIYEKLRNHVTSKKELAMAITNSEFKGIIFNMWDNKPYHYIIEKYAKEKTVEKCQLNYGDF